VSQAEPVRLSREVIVDAFLRITDEEGADAGTLRRLGIELRADPTSIYRHFRDKQELVAAAADRLLSDAFEGFRPSGSWRADVRELCLRGRAVYMTHPGVLLGVATTPTALGTGLLLAEHMLGAIRAAGLEDAEAVLAFEALEDYVVGKAGIDAASDNEGWRQVHAALPAGTFPNLTATASSIYRDPEEAFLYGLDLMLDALEARLERRAEGRGI
jgi:AcrR family transcriptional regulator